LLTKAHIVKAMLFTVVMHGCESWTIKKAESEVSVAQSCPTLCDPMDYSPQGSTLHGILNGKNTEIKAEHQRIDAFEMCC